MMMQPATIKMSFGGFSRLPPQPLVAVALTRAELHTLARQLEREADAARAERQDHLAERLDNRAADLREVGR